MSTGMRNTGMWCWKGTRGENYTIDRDIRVSAWGHPSLSVELGSGNLRSHGEAVNVMLWGLMSSKVELSVGVMREVWQGSELAEIVTWVLQDVTSSYTLILVIVDHLSKQSLFILTHDTITSPQLAQLFVLHVFSKHCVPSHITSDHGMEFVSHFFWSLGTALDMKLHFTFGYHPEGDGQTEWTNQTLEQYLQVYCNYQQDN